MCMGLRRSGKKCSPTETPKERDGEQGKEVAGGRGGRKERTLENGHSNLGIEL